MYPTPQCEWLKDDFTPTRFRRFLSRFARSEQKRQEILGIRKPYESVSFYDPRRKKIR